MRTSCSQNFSRTSITSEWMRPSVPIPQTAASNLGSSRSMCTTSPPATTSSSERTKSGNGPQFSPEPWVEVDTTPAIVCSS